MVISGNFRRATREMSRRSARRRLTLRLMTIKVGDVPCRGGMVMYKFEIYGKESPDKITHYYWQLVAFGNDGEAIVAASRSFASRAEAESEVHALRRGAGRADVEDPGAHSLPREDLTTTFRLVPDVASLRVPTPEWHHFRIQESRLARRGDRAPVAGPDRPRLEHEAGPAPSDIDEPPAERGRPTATASAPRPRSGRTRRAT
jgi:hypothetical protein